VGDGQARAAQEAARMERNADAESVRLTGDMANKKQNREYQKFEQSRSKLPAWAAKSDISRALATHQVRQQPPLHTISTPHTITTRRNRLTLTLEQAPSLRAWTWTVGRVAAGGGDHWVHRLR